MSFLRHTHFPTLSFLYTASLSGWNTTTFNILLKAYSHSALLRAATRAIPSCWAPPPTQHQHLDGHRFVVVYASLEHRIACFPCQCGARSVPSLRTNVAGTGLPPLHCKETWGGGIKTSRWPDRRKKRGEPTTGYPFLASSGGKR